MGLGGESLPTVSSDALFRSAWSRVEIQTLRSQTPLESSLTLPLTQGHEQLATDLFDHYGSLRPEFIDHLL
jgi:hypothetical protein